MKQKILDFYNKYETRFEIGFFVGGFILDAILISEVDDPFAIVQQVVYLIIIAALIQYEILFRSLKWRPSGRMIKLWEFRDLALHFSLGSLLNLYSLFYIKSASLISSIGFLALMIAIICANELPVVKKSNVGLKFGLFAICVFSFFSVMFPLLLGFLGWTPFLLAILATFGVFWLQLRFLRKQMLEQKVLFRAILAPGCSVLAVFVIFYFMGWIPPVPLSVVEQGIYHNVEKVEGEYLLSTEKDWWKYWQSGDQDFRAQPGDKIYFYAQIYSPARFADEVFVKWSYKDNKGNWQPSDKIPLKIVGGRKTGFRGYTIKSNYQPGQWRVQILTAADQEVSRLHLEVTPVATNEARVFEIVRK